MSPQANPQLASLQGSDPKLNMRVLKTRHDLHNSVGHVLGFGEMLLEEALEEAQDDLVPELERIINASRQLIPKLNEELDSGRIEAGLGDIAGLEQLLSNWATHILASVETLEAKAPASDGIFKSDLSRIAGAARRTRELAHSSLPHLTTAVPGETTFLVRAVNPLLEILPERHSTQTFIQGSRQGTILVVDDLAENRELLSRRLVRLGYSVETFDNGEEALKRVKTQPPDLVLLDILMPGLDGFEVLRRLKNEIQTQHLPVIMLSSADQNETAVRCIELGADDFLPKPFNPTLLVARIESSLAKKRLRDQETAFLQRLRIERDLSERLLLNILPKPIAERLKQGEQIIADSFSEVTVLFSDFVDFTPMAARIPPRVLVGRLNEIFSAFDHLCGVCGLEKIKMIGDAYMAVSGLPTPMANHAQAAADLALEMQREARRLAAIHEYPFRMRIGLHTGPVVAGVIGSKKFAYDLWGDTVNLASRMESHAPVGGILVTAATFERLREGYEFAPGRVVTVKGKGDIMSYPLTGRKSV